MKGMGRRTLRTTLMAGVAGLFLMSCCALAATAAPLVSSGGTYVVSWHVDGDKMPLNKVFDLDVTVHKAADHKPAEGVKLAVNATMPAHHHGMNVKPVVKPVDAGNWLVSGMLFHMPGNWQITLDIDNGTGTEPERVQFDVAVK
jgi:hypothetical protein